jgi:Transposase IS116/IS110/IS902 family
VAAARCELAAGFTQDLRGTGAAIRDTRKKLAAAVRAAGTSLTGLCGAGPVIAAAVIGDVRAVSRFPGRDHFAACTGAAPIEVSSGGRKIWRLSRRGNRRLNHAIRLAAVTQIRHRHSAGRACYGQKLAEGKTRKEALRALKRQVSDAIYACLQAAARAAGAKSPGGQPGERLTHQRGRLTPRTPALRESHCRARHPPCDPGRQRRRCCLSRTAAIPRERANGSRTGRSPAVQRRRHGVLDAAACEPVMPAAGKEGTQAHGNCRPEARSCTTSALPP